MKTNTSRLDAEFIEAFEAEHARLVEEADALRQEVASVEADIKRMKAVLRIMRPEEWAVAKQPSKKNDPPTYSAERIAFYMQHLRRLAASNDGEVRQVDLRAAAGIRSSAASTVFRQLRDEGFIRLSRVDAKTGSKFFRLTNDGS